MQLLDVTAKNFLSFLEFSYNYSAQGLTNIDGNDEDLDVKTGAGKSTFLDIPCYAFFGKTSKDLKADEVINWDTKKDLEIHFRFQKEDGIYEIHRYRKHKDHENDFYLVDPLGPMVRGKDARETQKILESLLGFDYDIFKKAIYFGQFDDTDKFLSSTDKEKKDLISTICDLSAYEEKLELVKEEIKEDLKQLNDVKQKHSILESSYNTTDKHLCSVGETFQQWNKNQKEQCEKLTQQVDDEQERLNNEISKLKSEVKLWDENYQVRVKELEDNINHWEEGQSTKIALLEGDSLKWINNQESLIRTMSKDIYKIEDDLKISKEEYKKLSSVETLNFVTLIVEVENKIKDLKGKEREGDKLFAEQQHLVRLNNDLKGEIVKENHKKTNGLGSECPHCYQEMKGESIDRKIQALYADGKKRKEEIESIQLKIDQINKDMMIIEEYNKELKEINEKQNQQTMRNMNLRTIQDKVNGLQRSLDNKLGDIELEKERGNPFRLSIETTCNAKNPYMLQVESLKAEKNPIIPSLKAAEKKENPFPELLAKNLEQKNPHGEQLITLEKELKAQEDKLYQHKTDMDKLEHQISLGEFWKAGLGTYIKSMLMDSFLEQLNIQANEYLDTLFDGILKIELASVTEGKKGVKEKISQKIFNGNHECSYSALSGGERCRICLAVNLALSDITCKSLGKSFSLLMLDEIFTGLDNAGKTQTMKLLKELETRFETILVIDHTDEFKSLFSNVITVNKKGGVSRII